MEIVEKCFDTLRFLRFGAGINCGIPIQNVHRPVEKNRYPYIFAPKTLDSCLPLLHTLHIFWHKRLSPISFGDFGKNAKRAYPQTHNLWIKSLVDKENPGWKADPRFWAKLCTGCPHRARPGEKQKEKMYKGE